MMIEGRKGVMGVKEPVKNYNLSDISNKVRFILTRYHKTINANIMPKSVYEDK